MERMDVHRNMEAPLGKIFRDWKTWGGGGIVMEKVMKCEEMTKSHGIA